MRYFPADSSFRDNAPTEIRVAPTQLKYDLVSQSRQQIAHLRSMTTPYLFNFPYWSKRLMAFISLNLLR